MRSARLGALVVALGVISLPSRKRPMPSRMPFAVLLHQPRARPRLRGGDLCCQTFLTFQAPAAQQPTRTAARKLPRAIWPAPRKRSRMAHTKSADRPRGRAVIFSKSANSEPVRATFAGLRRRHFRQWAAPHDGNLTPSRTAVSRGVARTLRRCASVAPPRPVRASPHQASLRGGCGRVCGGVERAGISL